MCTIENALLEVTDASVDAFNEASHSPAVDILDQEVDSQYVAGFLEVPLVEETARPALLGPASAAAIRRRADYRHLPDPEGETLYVARVSAAYAHSP